MKNCFFIPRLDLSVAANVIVQEISIGDFNEVN